MEDTDIMGTTTYDVQPETSSPETSSPENSSPENKSGVAVAEHSDGALTEPAGAHGGSKLHDFASYDPADFPAITGREEEWRFTPLDRLNGLHNGTAGTDGKVVVEVDAAPEVQVERVGRGDPRVGASYAPYDRVAALAFSTFETATVLTVPAQTKASRPTFVSVRGEGRSGGAYGHTLIALEPHAEAVVVLDHQGSATYADNVELVLADGAALTVVSVQDWADDAVHLSHQHIQLGRDARIKHVAVTFGGDLVRVFPSVSYTDSGGDAELLGMYFADAGQHLEHRLYVDHSHPRCRSNVVYKGALQGAGAHTVWIGDVLIRPAAEGIQTFELNRNLVLTEGARADSVPNLEIETGEIEGAGHASATGRFDDEQLFYLQARGIPEDQARRLVVHGFFAELVTRIGVPDLQERLLAAIERELQSGVSTGTAA